MKVWVIWRNNKVLYVGDDEVRVESEKHEPDTLVWALVHSTIDFHKLTEHQTDFLKNVGEAMMTTSWDTIVRHAKMCKCCQAALVKIYIEDRLERVT